MNKKLYITLKASLALSILISIISCAQNNFNFVFDNKDSSSVYCFSKGETTIKLYRSSVDNVIIDSLLSLVNEEHCWYVFELSKSENGRFKIKNATVLPSCRELKLPKYKGMWIDKSNDLLIDSVFYDF